MTKQQREIIITVGLVFILVIALTSSFRRMKKKRLPRKEEPKVEASASETEEAETIEVSKKEPASEEVRKMQLARWGQSWKRNPFLLPQREKEKSILREEGFSFSLSGIVWKEGAPLALIDDYIVRKGETLEGYTVANITQDRVILEQDGKKYELFLGRR